MPRLCHRLIACSIAGKSQAPKKVIVTGLFYLRGMDVGSVNIPYLLTRYLRVFALGRKHGASQPPPVVAQGRTITQSLGRLEEDVHRLRGALGKQREDLTGKEIDKVGEVSVI
ncbi:hypothetical protein Tco_0365033 [Tanacetum coccineum]